MARRTVLAVVALVAASAGLSRVSPAEARAGAPPLAPASIGIRLLEAPAGAEDDPRAQVHIVDHLLPGTVIQRQIEVSSTAGATMGVELYPAAATIDDGAFTGADGRTANEISSWTDVGPSGLRVPAGGTAKATVTITVPSDAAAGERYGVVWAEARSAPTEDNPVAQVVRVGMRLYLSIGPGAAPAADFEIRSLTAGRTDDGTPTVMATVENTGGRALDLAGTLDLTDGPGGVRAGPFPATLGTTLGIGDAEPVTILLDERLPAGPWDASIALHSGALERSAMATITFPRSGAAAPVPASRPDGRSPLDTVLPVVAALAVLALAAGLLRWRRRLRSPLAISDR